MATNGRGSTSIEKNDSAAKIIDVFWLYIACILLGLGF
jgi:hypothetical protein